MRADAGNSSSVAFALTGATPAVPVPIWIRITAPGVGNVYYDGLGVTPAMVGVTIVDSVNIVLTGAGLGMAITPGVGSQVAGDTWKATCSGLADQTPNGRNAVQLTPAFQPIITTGLNGKVGILFDGIDDLLTYTLALPNPSVASATGMYGVVRALGIPGGLTSFCTDAQGAANPGISIIGLGSQAMAYAGGGGTNTRVTLANPSSVRMAAGFSGSAADYQWIGANKQTALIGSGGSSPARAFGGVPVALACFLRYELFSWSTTPYMITPAQLTDADAAINSAGGYGAAAIEI